MLICVHHTSYGLYCTVCDCSWQFIVHTLLLVNLKAFECFESNIAYQIDMNKTLALHIQQVVYTVQVKHMVILTVACTYYSCYIWMAKDHNWARHTV